MSALPLFASAPAPLSGFLRDELHVLGASDIAIRGAGVAFEGDLNTAYRCCLWSRLASRILLRLRRFEAGDGDALYRGALAEDWSAHLHPGLSFAVDCSARRARIDHTHFAALRVKDAIADWFRQHHGERPSVDTRSPDLRIHLHLSGTRAQLYLDLAGAGLHQRGYRPVGVPAPLRETLAAGLLHFADWPTLAARGLPLLDPMCGSGTLLVEAAMMAGDIAPGLTRRRFGFEAWLQHDGDAWDGLRQEALQRHDRGRAAIPPIHGRDRDPGALATAAESLAAAGLSEQVDLEVADLTAAESIAGPGLLVTNPPYGERLRADDARRWREAIEDRYPDWHVALLQPREQPPLRGVGSRSMDVRNGPIDCRFDAVEPAQPGHETPPDTDALRNRLRKRQSHLARWARRKGVFCYRLYDADLPEFALAVDRYEADEAWLHVAEYEPPEHVDPRRARRRLDAALAVLADVTGVPSARIEIKQRRRQRGSSQYQRIEREGRFLEVKEGPARLLVNLRDFLDTGLFLDHRPVRRWIGDHARDARVLNLFAYTASATVHAALGGARSSLSLDLSRTYCDWARRNLACNGIDADLHRVEETDCVAWLATPERKERYDLVFLDPPTFSNSARMQGTLDIRRDHVRLIRQATAVLAPGGTLVFSCNRRGFRLDAPALSDLEVRDITATTVDEDFRGGPPPHRCYLLRHGA